MKLFGYISFFPAHREEEGRLLHHSASWKSWRIHNRLTFQRRRNSSASTAATSRWRRRRTLKLLRVVVAAADGSADPSNINTRANGGREPRQCARIDRPERARTEAKAHARISAARVARDSRAAGARDARIHHACSHLTLPRAWNDHNINNDFFFLTLSKLREKLSALFLQSRHFGFVLRSFLHFFHLFFSIAVPFSPSPNHTHCPLCRTLTHTHPRSRSVT